jgi:hypothetical protein
MQKDLKRERNESRLLWKKQKDGDRYDRGNKQSTSERVWQLLDLGVIY